MKVTFVTPCMDRLYHLAQTAPRNIAANPSASFLFVDFCSRESLADVEKWKNKKVSMVRVEGEYYYNAARAKNIGHRIAAETSDIVVNVDADMVLPENFDKQIVDMFKRQGDKTLFTSAKLGPAGGGLIAVSASHFVEMGGYDEAFVKGWGYEDVDFVSRWLRAGYTRRTFEQALIKMIEHSDKEREANIGYSLEDCRRLHQRIFALNNKIEATKVNVDDKTWGRSPGVKKVF